jgi:hypothetical protein
MARILAKRLEPYAEEIVGEYQCAFRRNRATTDQIFSIRMMLGKCYEYNINLHHLFIYYKQAYDSIYRKSLYKIMREFGMPQKLINLVKMPLTDTVSKVRVQGQISREFAVNRGLKQGDALSCICLTYAWRKL